MYARKSYQKLLDWKASSRRKPLIIRGARQVGKSTLVRQFSKEYKHFVELNLERAEDYRLFNLDSVDELIESVLVREGVSINSNSLLFFIDEIQESPRAIQFLRFFYEDFPHIHVICAGSLLEHVIKEIPSFPVGRVQQMLLHPFDFEEFLLAKGNIQLAEVFSEIPVKPHLHQVLLKTFNEFTIIGGMPELVKTFFEESSYSGLKEVYEEIWQTYKEDVEKYAKNSTERKVIRHIIETAAHEKDRISLSGFGNSNYRNREIGAGLRALGKARLIQMIYPTISTKPPQEIDFTRKPRLQFLDTGLLNYVMGIQSEMIGLNDLTDFYRGRIIQHMVFQQLQSQCSTLNDELHFWVREKTNSNAEVDLVYQFKNLIIPIEVKSGSHGRLRSLHQFIDQTNHPYALRLLGNKLSIENVTTPGGKKYKLMNLPYYLSSKIPEYCEWFVK